MGRLLSLSDFTIRYMQTGVQSTRFDVYIVEAENMDIRKFLGDALFYDFVEGIASSPQEEIYTNLLNGTTYTCGTDTIEFRGIGEALQYFAYSRYLMDNGLVHTKTGSVHKTDEFSDRPSNAEIQRKIDQAESAGRTALDDARKFLNENFSSYPLWYNRPKKRSNFRVI